MEIEQIYNMYFKDVFRYVYSMTKNESLSEDITQETFLKVLKSIKNMMAEKIFEHGCLSLQEILYIHITKGKKSMFRKKIH